MFDSITLSMEVLQNFTKFECMLLSLHMFHVLQVHTMSMPATKLSFCCITFMLFSGIKWLLQCFILLFGHFRCHEIT